MKPVGWLLAGLAIGGIVGWYARDLSKPDVRASDPLRFNDELSDPQQPYLLAAGTWRGTDLANKVNTVSIVCDGSKMTCDLVQANVTAWSGSPTLSLYQESFRITKLDAHSMIAETGPSLLETCIRQTLTFDRSAKALTFVRTKIKREGVCTIIQDEPVTMFLGKP
jgi:succinate dehydrogenase/fumarate reductase flavoprotein subunit